MVSQHLVTRRLWSAVPDAGVAEHIYNCIVGSRPMTGVSLDDVYGFIRRLNSCNTGYRFRLLWEYEWLELAGEGGYMYPGSDNLDDVGWYDENCTRLKPVGKKRPSLSGLYDLVGNAAEFVYAPAYQFALCLGGGFRSNWAKCKADDGGRFIRHTSGFDDVGFRLVADGGEHE